MLLKSFNASIRKGLTSLFGIVLEFILAHPKKVVLAGIVFAVISGIYAYRNLTFLPNFAGLSNNQSSYNKNYNDFNEEFNQEPAMVVVAEGPDVQKNEAFLGALADRLKTDPTIERAVYKVDLRPFLRWAMAYLSPADLQKVLTTVKTAKPLFQSMDDHTGLVSFWQSILGLAQSVSSGQGISGQNAQSGLDGLSVLKKIVDLMTSNITGKGGKLALNGAFGDLSGLPVSEYSITQQNGSYDLYLTLENGRYAFLTAYATRDKNGIAMLEPAVAHIRAAMKELAPQFPQVETHLTGEPVMGVDEMLIAKHDISVAGIISLILCSAIFILGFMELRKPILSVICLFIGTGWSLGYITLSVKHLNVFTISLFPMLIGLAIDFSIQFMGRYREERSRMSAEEAIRKTYFSTGTGLLTAALTTALGFFAISFTEYTGIAELGTATGGALILCFISTMTILPALLLLTETTDEVQEQSSQTMAMGIRTEKFLLRHAGWVVFIGFLLTVFLGAKATAISFDHDILNLEAKGTDSVKTELDLVKVASKSSIFAVMVADNPQQARLYMNQLETLSTVSSVQSPLAFIPQDQNEKMPLLRELRSAVSDFNIAAPNQPVDVKRLAAIFEQIHSKLGQAEYKLSTTGSALGLLQMFILPGNELYFHNATGSAPLLAQAHDAITEFKQSVDAFLVQLHKTNPDKAAAALTKFQNDLFDQVKTDFSLISHGIPDRPITFNDLPPLVKNQFIGKTGKILIEVFPSSNIWQRPELERFVAQLREIDPNVTGAPVLIYETTKEMLNSYEAAAKIAFFVIVVVAFLEFRNLYLTILTLIPLGVGLLWLMGVMIIFGKSFNPANLITLPVILGIGVAFGVYVVNRFREDRQASIFSTSTGKSVLLSALTSTAGFASLLFVNHEGLKSLGFTMTVGLCAITIQALVILPALIQLSLNTRPER